MRVLVTGATGLIGQSLCKRLLQKKHELIVVGRDSESQFRSRFIFPCEYYTWDNFKTSNIQAVFHLAGESIAGARWTPKKKDAILNSRVQTTRKLVEALEGNWPRVFIGASAIGYYGDRAHEILYEKSKMGSGFLAEVCNKWEESAEPFRRHCRVVHLRLGIVLDATGGILERLEKPFSVGLGGKIDKGDQWMSWIHLEDASRMFYYALTNPLKGVYNAVAPTPLTNTQLTQEFAHQLGVNAFLSVPRFILKLAFGEMAQLATSSQRVSSNKIEKSGFKFDFVDFRSALHNIYEWKQRAAERLFKTEHWFTAEANEVFSLFRDAKNLEKITPPWLRFKLLNQSTENIEKGTLIDYVISIRGFPIKWKTEIQNWNPPHLFVDDQIKGPFKRWHHAHQFDPYPKGILMKDQIVYQVPFGRLGSLLIERYVRKDIMRIFAFRKQSIDRWILANPNFQNNNNKNPSPSSHVHSPIVR
ncbi:MAG: TIGR01777 family oxidoreductase [Bdellovibrionales bacterium]|nr:TIGR01777 family oxidoreductase [Bdellovibrionales bacterium]